MQKYFLLGLTAGVLLFASNVMHAQESSTTKGAEYLVSQQLPDGSWSEDEKLKLTDSSESFQALHRVDGGEKALNKSLQFFASMDEENSEFLARKLLPLSRSTADVSGLMKKLLTMQKSDGGWGIFDSKQGSVPHTILTLNALLASGKAPDAKLSDGASFLIKTQHSDGSWIFASEHSLSDTAHTAMALLVLKAMQNANLFTGSGLEQAVAKAQQCLQGKEDADGSYGTLIDSAWAYLALAKVKQPAKLQKTLSLITSAQLANGSWNNKIYDTAICLQALTAIRPPMTEDLPDLEISAENIHFTPATPAAGDEVTMQVTIFNNGYDFAKNVKVDFFNRDPRIDGVELSPMQMIPVIPDGGSAQIITTFSTKGMAGAVPIMVFLDRENMISESSKTNNSAIKLLEVDASQVNLPNLTIFGLSFSNENPLPGDIITTYVTIHNTGRLPAPASCLLLTFGCPFISGSSIITEVDVPALEVDASVVLSVEIAVTGDLSDLFGMIDSAEAIDEISEDDNVYNAAWAGEPLPDLIVEASSVSFSHTNLDDGPLVTINFTVENTSGADADSFKVNILRKQDGEFELIDLVAIQQLAGGQSRDCSIMWLATTGNSEFAIVVDTDNEITEICENNNTASVRKTFSRTAPRMKFYRMIDEEWQESYIFKPYETIKIVMDDELLKWYYDPIISSGEGNFLNMSTFFLYFIGHQPPGAHTITMERWDAEIIDYNAHENIIDYRFFLVDTVARNFTLEAEFNLNEVTIQAVPSILHSNQLQPVDLALLINSRSNIPGRATGTVKVSDPDGKVVLTHNISSFEVTPGKLEAISVENIAGIFVNEGRYVIETTFTPEDNRWESVTGKRSYDVFPGDTLKVTKTLTPTVLDPLEEAKVHMKIDLGSVSSFVESPSIDLIFVIDESGYMGKEEIQRAREIVYKLTDMLPDNARSACVRHQQEESCTIAPLCYNRQSLKDAVKDAFQHVPHSGDISDGMREARLHFIDNYDPMPKRIEIILSNGYLRYNSGDDDATRYQEMANAVAENITIYTIGIASPDLNETWLTQAPDATGGRYLLEPTTRDLELVFGEIFSSSFGVSATAVTLTDSFNTEDVELIVESIIPAPSLIDTENGKIVWTLDTIHTEKKYSMEFDLLLRNLKQGEERVINKDLNVDFATPENETNFSISAEEKSIKVNELGSVLISTDKDRYTEKEVLQTETQIVLTGNKVKKYSSHGDWETVEFDNILFDNDLSELKLSSTHNPELRNLVLNGDFEQGRDNKYWVLSHRFYITNNNYLNFSGEYSLQPCVYYGSFCSYQTVKIPKIQILLYMHRKIECVFMTQMMFYSKYGLQIEMETVSKKFMRRDMVISPW